MKAPLFLLPLVMSVLSSQAVIAADEISPDTVVAIVNGQEVTAGQVDLALTGAPPRMQENFKQDLRSFLAQNTLLMKLAGMAEEEGLHKKSPVKEQLEWSHLQVMMQMAIIEHNKRIRAQVEQGSSEGEQSTEEQLRQWMESVRTEVNITYENEEFYSSSSPSVASDTVIATIDGKPLNFGEIERILGGASPQIRQNFKEQPKQFLAEYALMLCFAKIAEDEKLDQQSPYKEQLAWARSERLAQAKLNYYTDHINILPEDELAYYESHRDQYTQAKVKVLYISFAADASEGKSSDGKEILSEKEAEARINSLYKQISEGADFVQLVKEHSEDATSVAQDGDFGTIRLTDQIPEHIKEVIFALKAGQVSTPVRQPNGFYLFRVEEIGTQSLDEVRNDLNRDAKNAKFQEWFDSVQQSIKITYKNEAYFAQPQAK